MTFRSLIWLPVLLLGGCAVRVQHGLDERQANELQTVLVERGLDAHKVLEEGKHPTWAIEVDRERASDAVRILSELGLPRPKNEGFREIFKPGLVPDPVEQHALFLEAEAGELAQTLEAVDGVATARVHLVLPSAVRAGAATGPAKASAFLRLRPGATERLEPLRNELRALVAGGVEGLSPEAVTLVFSEAVEHAPALRPVPDARASWLPLALAALLCASAAAAAAVGLRLRRRHESRRRSVSVRTPVVSVPARRAS